MTVFSQLIQSFVDDVGSRRKVRSAASIEKFHSWVQAQPKVETHVHLEAGVAPGFYESLNRPNTWSSSYPWQRAPFANLREFIMAWVDLSRSIRTPSDVEALAESFVASRVPQNIRYTEAYFSPADLSFMRRRFQIAPEIFDFSEVLHAYVRGLKRGLAAHPGFEVRLVMDALWPSTADERLEMKTVLRQSLESNDFFDAQGRPLIVAIGLGGSESHHDLEGHREFVNDVRALGFKIDIHSGEGNTVEMHRTSVETLSPDRVAHGFVGVQSGYLFGSNVVMCPLSNLLLKTFSGRAEDHPAFRLLREDVPILIGSDDPLLLGHDLSAEFSFIYAIEESFDESKFLQIQENTRKRVFAPGVCEQVLS
ncbi:MAG: hypothetical protein FJY29_07535 [Betaproteobacteria bacterium]|nr:hypothetical protein [Betaproteobacteria bacterium]